jgi:hypothetical protein
MTDFESYSMNETLLQYYRTIFISSESFLLTVGAIVVDKSLIVFLLIAGISIYMIWDIWYEVVGFRHLIVDYYKYHIGSKYLCTEDQYVDYDEQYRDALNNANQPSFTTWRETRIKMDRLIPTLFTIVWGILILYALYEYLLTFFYR